MKKYVSSIFTVLLSIFVLTACGEEASEKKQNDPAVENTTNETSDYPRTFTDGRGVEVTIEEKPSRIVSTTLAIDEYLMALAEPERIAAVTQMSTDGGISNVAGKTDEIGTKIETVTAELVLSLKPDLVLIPSFVNPEVLEQLEAAGVTTYQLKDESSFDGILASVKEIGALIGEEEKAANIITDVNERIAALEEKAASVKEKKRVLYWTQHNSSVTENTTIGEMITLAGGVNVITEAGITGDEYPEYPNLSKEKLVELNPDVIITSDWQYDGSKATFVDEWKNDPALQNVSAFKNDQVHVVDSANLTTVSQYIIEGAEDIHHILYGE